MILVALVVLVSVQESRSHRLKDLEIDELFQDILRWHRRGVGGSGCGTRGPWVGPDSIELFALAYPEKVEPLAREVLEDPEAPYTDILYMLRILPRYSSRTSREIESILLRLTQHHEDMVVDWALERLSSLSGIDRHRKLFLQHCVEGRDIAFDAVSFEGHPDTILFLIELDVEAGPGRISIQCRTALERIRVLQSSDWRNQLLRIFDWELETDQYYWAEQATFRRAPELLRPRYERRMSKIRRLTKESNDWNWELMIYDEIGGRLTESETRRLKRVGLLGAAEDRLIEHFNLKPK